MSKSKERYLHQIHKVSNHKLNGILKYGRRKKFMVVQSCYSSSKNNKTIKDLNHKDSKKLIRGSLERKKGVLRKSRSRKKHSRFESLRDIYKSISNFQDLGSKNKLKKRVRWKENTGKNLTYHAVTLIMLFLFNHCCEFSLVLYFCNIYFGG